MRALYLGLAAAFCLLALSLKLFSVSDLATVVALLIAGIFLVLGLRISAENRIPQPVEIDEQQRESLRAMLDRGDEGAAVRQVQLWFRDASPQQARAAVQELKGSVS